MKLAAAMLASAAGVAIAQEAQQLVWGDALIAVVEDYGATTYGSGPLGTTTYRLSVNLKDTVDVASVYKIYGSPTSPMSIPAAYQAPPDFGSNFGGTNPALWSVANSDVLGYAEFDSFLSVGIADGDPAQALTSAEIDWAGWTASSDLSTTGSVFWTNAADSLNQASTTWPTPILVAQLTVPTGTSAEVTMGVGGCATAGCAGSDGWIADGVTFTIGLVCAAVENADASTLTCTSSTNSQVTACAAGFSICESGGTEACVDGTQPDPSADACVPTPPIGLVCTAVENADASTLTCTSSTDSQVTACAAGFSICESGGTEACADGTQPDPSADTCVPTPSTCGDAFACPDGDVLMPDPGAIACAEATCTAAECCSPSCGDVDNDGDGGAEADDAFPVSDCGDGLVLKEAPLTIGCPSGTCNSNYCCEPPSDSTAGPNPTPPPPASPPAVSSGSSRAARVSTAAGVVGAIAMMTLASTL